MAEIWKAYYPECGETADDARVLKPRWDHQRIWDAEDAARRACEIDYSERDGWERGLENDFQIVVVAPDGTETRWKGCHVPSVDHCVEEVDEDA
jgi:hypothetical protein